MANYFDQIIERRGTNSSKWDKMNQVFGRDDLIPMWVADSDWPTAEPVINSLKNRIEHGILGYTFPGENLTKAVVSWVKNRYHWDIKKEWLVYTAGVVPSINFAIQTFTIPGDEVILQSPVYYPFFTAVKNNGCHILNNQLQENGEKYIIDFENLNDIVHINNDRREEASRAQIFLLCNPHNPVGRVWTKEELINLGEFCLNNDILVISDEIHADFTFEPHKHTVFASVKNEFAQNSITLISPSKSFNIAGLNGSIAIIPNENLRTKFKYNCQGIMNSNILSLTAMEAAYEKGDKWLDAQLNYLDKNLNYAADFINNNIKQVSTYKPEGTYLLWLNFKKMGLSDHNLKDFMINKAKVALDPGTWFGTGGEGFMRLNAACPLNMLKKGLMRIYEAVNKELRENNV